MNINIGENIKNLRKRKDITQEELAEHLGISFQSVSKWERGDGLPDITMLPDLADFFNISIDSLIGADRTSGGDLYNIYKKSHEFELSGNYDAAIDLLRDTLTQYPNNFDLTSKLSSVLLLKNSDSSDSSDFSDSEESKILAAKAVKLCERDLNGDIISEKARAMARASLGFLYDNTGDRQKAIELTRNLPHVWESREILWGELMDGQEYADYLKKLILIFLSVINAKIDRVYDGSKKINVIDMLTLSPPCDDIINPENRNAIIGKIIGFMDDWDDLGDLN